MAKANPFIRAHFKRNAQTKKKRAEPCDRLVVDSRRAAEEVAVMRIVRWQKTAENTRGGGGGGVLPLFICTLSV